MKIITAKEFISEYNFMNLDKDWALALVEDQEEINCITLSWASIGYLWREPTLSVYIHKDRYSQHIFNNAKFFSFSIFNEKYRDVLIYAGKASGRNEDKIKGSGLTILRDEETNVPYFCEGKYTLLCKVMGYTKFNLKHLEKDTSIYEWYQAKGVHNIYEGKIIKIIKQTD